MLPSVQTKGSRSKSLQQKVESREVGHYSGGQRKFLRLLPFVGLDSLGFIAAEEIPAEEPIDDMCRRFAGRYI